MQALVDRRAVASQDAALQADTQMLKMYGLSCPRQLDVSCAATSTTSSRKSAAEGTTDRYATADAFASDLKRYLNHETRHCAARVARLSNA
jgi:hypothetical protein